MSRDRFQEAMQQIDRCSQQTVLEITRCYNPERMAELCNQLDRLDDGRLLVGRLLDKAGSSHAI